MSALPLPGENEIYERMVDSILDHRLPPGTKLVEDRLATAFGVSRTRIRPVLVRLANEQIVTLTPHRGATVAQPTEREAREVFEVRRLIEPTLLACFIERASDADLASLGRCIDEEEAAQRAGESRRAIRLAGDFHLRIGLVAAHQTLGRILRELVSRTSLILMTYGDRHHAAPVDAVCRCREHRSLLQAIRLRDAQQGATLMREHLSQVEAQLLFNPPGTESPDLLSLFGRAAPVAAVGRRVRARTQSA